MSANVFRQWTRPTRWYRQVFFIVGGQQQYNFDGDLTDRQVQLYGYFQPLNYWDFNAFWIHRPGLLDDQLARGGPVLRRPGIDFYSTNISTDSRKRVVGNVSAEMGCATDGTCDRFLGVNLQIRPASNVSLSVGPALSHDETRIQYVTAYDDPAATAFYGGRYVFADVTQEEVSMNTRFNVTFSPNLTFELFLQPLISSADYSHYKEFAEPRSDGTLEYGQDFGTCGPCAATRCCAGSTGLARPCTWCGRGAAPRTSRAARSTSLRTCTRCSAARRRTSSW
jgi:hypothetical protein